MRAFHPPRVYAQGPHHERELSAVRLQVGPLGFGVFLVSPQEVLWHQPPPERRMHVHTARRPESFCRRLRIDLVFVLR